MNASFAILIDSQACIVLQDLGPWDKHRTITNDAEAVVRKMHVHGLGTRRLFYYDSEGELTELIHDGDGGFIDFKMGAL